MEKRSGNKGDFQHLWTPNDCSVCNIIILLILVKGLIIMLLVDQSMLKESKLEERRRKERKRSQEILQLSMVLQASSNTF